MRSYFAANSVIVSLTSKEILSVLRIAGLANELLKLLRQTPLL